MVGSSFPLAAETEKWWYTSHQVLSASHPSSIDEFMKTGHQRRIEELDTLQQNITSTKEKLTYSQNHFAKQMANMERLDESSSPDPEMNDIIRETRKEAEEYEKHWTNAVNSAQTALEEAAASLRQGFLARLTVWFDPRFESDLEPPISPELKDKRINFLRSCTHTFEGYLPPGKQFGRLMNSNDLSALRFLSRFPRAFDLTLLDGLRTQKDFEQAQRVPVLSDDTETQLYSTNEHTRTRFPNYVRAHWAILRHSMQRCKTLVSREEELATAAAVAATTAAAAAAAAQQAYLPNGDPFWGG